MVLKPEVQRCEHSVLQVDKGYFPIAVLSTDGDSLVVQFDEGMISGLTNRNIDEAVECLRDAFYRLRPDLRKQ
jgi:hypothetical protein